MVDVISTTASITGLISATFSLIEKVRDALERVNGEPKALNDIFKRLTALERSLGLVRDEKELQTAAVQEQVAQTAEITEELRLFFERLVGQRQQGKAAQVFRALSSGSSQDKQLQGVLGRLDSARDELALRISVAQVGLVGNLKDGFSVASDVLLETNVKVREVLGINLVIADQLRDKLLQRTDKMLMIDAAEMERIGVAGGHRESTNPTPTNDRDETSIVDNITLRQARLMVGNIGVDNWYRTAGRKAVIGKNLFADDVRIMVGDQGGDAARSFHANFWA